MAMLMFYTIVITVVAAVGALADVSDDTLKSMWGFTANGILLIYYAAPLSTIIVVVRSRSSATLYWPLAVANTVNGVLWLIYGLAISDLFIAVPNGVGAVFSLVLLALILIYPNKSAK
jgi:solute carrier family 50 protein (sugar transporter)